MSTDSTALQSMVVMSPGFGAWGQWWAKTRATGSLISENLSHLNADLVAERSYWAMIVLILASFSAAEMRGSGGRSVIRMLMDSNPQSCTGEVC